VFAAQESIVSDMFAQKETITNTIIAAHRQLLQFARNVVIRESSILNNKSGVHATFSKWRRGEKGRLPQFL
jgi:hypothetical protein